MSADVTEIRQRVTRIETRLMLLATALGINLRPEEDFEIDVEAKVLKMQTLDIPFTSVINACHRAGLSRVRVRVHHGENIVGEVFV